MRVHTFNKALRNINLFCLTYLVLWTFVPIFSLYTSQSIFRFIYAIIVCIWCATALENLSYKQAITILYMVVFFGVMLVYWGIGYGDCNLNNFINYILLFGVGINCNYYFRINSFETFRYIVYLISICCIITSITTLIGLYANSNAARLLTSSSTSDFVTYELQKKNIGSFDFIYGACLMIIPLLSSLKSKISPKIKLVFFSLAVLFFLCILKANFTIAIILIFIGLVIWISTFPQSKVYRLIFIFFGIPLVVFLPQIFKIFLEFVMESTTSIYATDKLQSIIDVIEGNGAYADTSIRFQLMKNSLDTFFSYPIFGGGAYFSTTSNITEKIGQHAQFLDDLARFGIVGGGSLLVFVLRSIKELNNNIKAKLIDSRIIPTILLLLLGILNPIYNDGILFIYFIYYPSLQYLINYYGARKNNENNVCN